MPIKDKRSKERGLRTLHVVDEGSSELPSAGQGWMLRGVVLLYSLIPTWKRYASVGRVTGVDVWFIF